MAPTRRPNGDHPPVYGVGTQYFSVQINHGAFFVGSGSGKRYESGSFIWYDYVDTATWSPTVLENLVEDIGYEMYGRIKVLYCIPNLSISRNGLREIRSDEDTIQMSYFVSIGHQSFFLYLDHEDSMRERNWNDGVNNPAPMTRSHKSTAKEQEEGDDSGDEDDEDPNFEFRDSDYGISDGDDDLYADNVDEDEDTIKKTNVKCEHKVEGDGDSEQEDLWLPESDEEKFEFRFNSFKVEDMKDPKFKSGQVFENVEMLRKAIREYSCLQRRAIKMPINDKKRLCARCVEGCSWYLWASFDNRHKAWMIKRLNDEHTCSRKFKISAFTANFIAEKYLESFRADQDMNLKNFSRVVQKEWNMTPGRTKMQRARRIAMRTIYGDEEQQYKLLWDYGNEIRRSNPGSSFFLALNASGRFQRCYMSLEACKRGFLQGCRPIIFVDGCFIKTRYRGQLLAAVGIDPNDCIFPIAFAAVEVEDTSSWTWFLQTLKNDLGIINTAPWTLMSDKQKGLINAVRDQFPESEHRFCVRHMWQNFQQVFRSDALKNQLWMIARSSTIVNYEKNMEYMKVLNPEAYAWLDKLDPKTWVRAFQSDLPKCDILLNNNCEVFNKYILDARELPLLSMFDRMKDQLMTRHYTKEKESMSMNGLICPKIKKKLDKNIEWSNNAYVEGAGDGLFKVCQTARSTPTDYIVDIKSKTCTCKRWEKSGIPCPHAISAIRHDELDPVDFVDKCYSVEMYKKAYSNIVYPCKDKTEWEKMNGPLILPPAFQRHVGRPTRCRRKAPGKVDARTGGKKMSRHGVIMHCSWCGEPDHNIGGCKYLKDGVEPPISSQDHGTPEGSQQNQEHAIPQQSQAENASPNTYDNLVVDDMSRQRPIPRIIERRPIPNSSFLSNAQREIGNPQERSTLRQGQLSQQLQALQQERNRAAEDRKIEILEAKYEAQRRRAEDASLKKIEQEKRKAEEAQAKTAQAAARKIEQEKRKAEEAQAKAAQAAARKIEQEKRKAEEAQAKASQAAARKFEQEKRKAEQAQAKAAQAAARKEQRKYEVEINRLSKAETKIIIVETMKEVALEKKRTKEEKKLADKKVADELKAAKRAKYSAEMHVADEAAILPLHQDGGQSHNGGQSQTGRKAGGDLIITKRVNMFDEFR